MLSFNLVSMSFSVDSTLLPRYVNLSTSLRGVPSVFFLVHYIYIIIIIMSCHRYPWPSLATSPYPSSPLAGLRGYITYPHTLAAVWYVRAGHPAFARPYVGVHRSPSLMSSSLLLQQCPTCLVRLTWIVFVMGGSWLYRWCLMGCCRQVLFNIARNILV